jgi:hypothetical protein
MQSMEGVNLILASLIFNLIFWVVLSLEVVVLTTLLCLSFWVTNYIDVAED